MTNNLVYFDGPSPDDFPPRESSRRNHRIARRRQRFRRLHVEKLEDRSLLAAITPLDDTQRTAMPHAIQQTVINPSANSNANLTTTGASTGGIEGTNGVLAGSIPDTGTPTNEGRSKGDKAAGVSKEASTSSVALNTQNVVYGGVTAGLVVTNAYELNASSSFMFAVTPLGVTNDVAMNNATMASNATNGSPGNFQGPILVANQNSNPFSSPSNPSAGNGATPFPSNSPTPVTGNGGYLIPNSQMYAASPFPAPLELPLTRNPSSSLLPNSSSGLSTVSTRDQLFSSFGSSNDLQGNLGSDLIFDTPSITTPLYSSTRPLSAATVRSHDRSADSGSIRTFTTFHSSDQDRTGDAADYGLSFPSVVGIEETT